MKSIFVFAFLLVALCSAEKYTTENDDLDIQGVVSNPETFKAFVNCFNDKGDCNPAAADFKKDMPEAIQQACAKCTDAQKYIFRTFLDELKKHSADYKTYKEKYDPEDKYFAALNVAIANK